MKTVFFSVFFLNVMFILDYFPSPTRILHEIISSQMIQEQLQLQHQPHLNHLDQNHHYQGAMITPAGGIPPPGGGSTGGGGILKTTPMTSSSELLLQPNSTTNHMVVNSITKPHYVGVHHKSVTTTAPSGGGGGTGGLKIAPPRPPRARQKASVTNFGYTEGPNLHRTKIGINFNN